MMPSPNAAPITEAAALVEELTRFRVLPAEQLNQALTEFPGGSAGGLAEFLVARGEITPYQAERSLAGLARCLALGPYRLLDPHQPGTFGPIVRADKAGNHFALRVLPLRSLWQAKQAKQLLRNFAPTPHPAIVPLIDADSANGFHYLAWPLVSGERLADRVAAEGPLDPAETIRLMDRLATGLAACHDRGVVHGLITPQTILFGSDGLPALLEIGAGMLLASNLAADESLFDTMSTTIALAGAFDFAAPEWIANPAHPLPAGDQFSLGAIGYFALAGSPPSLADYLPLACEPPELGTILTRLLQPEPSERYGAMAEVREAIARLSALDRVVPEPRARSIVPSPAPANAAWQAPAYHRPAERDNSDASVGFDLPDDGEEHPNPFWQAARTIEPAETPRTLPSLPGATPSQWSAAAQRFSGSDSHPGEAPIGKPERRGPALPLLPPTPLVTDSPANSSAWNGTTKNGPATEEQPPASVLWKKMKRKMLFWQTAGDTVQVSVFGPHELIHSQTPKLTVFLHSPLAAESVATLARAFHHGAVLLGTCRLASEVMRGSRLDVHAAIENAVVTNPLASFTWQGQPRRLAFELVVPWEAPVGSALSVVSIGRDDVRIGKVEFPVPILDKPSA